MSFPSFVRRNPAVLFTFVFSLGTATGLSAQVATVPPATPVPASSIATVPPAPPTQSATVASLPAYDPAGVDDRNDPLGSTYIPVDSKIYPMALRLYSLGYLDTSFIDMRPWTRRSLLHTLNASASRILADSNDEAVGLLASLQSYIAEETPGPGLRRGRVYGVETGYTRMLGISGQTLRDSFNLGETLVNDYGRPYNPGFNNITGFSTVNEAGPFSLYLRGEYQHAPSGNGYSQALTQQISNNIDGVPYSGYNLHQPTIPSGPVAGTDTFALQEATLSVHLFGHEISGGKSDAWLSPAVGSAMGWNNNAQDIYAFRFNRVDPLYIPFLSRITGTFDYDFFVGSLKGHTYPNDPWIHSETVAIAPTSNVRVSFQRVVIWGGKSHEPITIHTFLKSFFNFDDVSGTEKQSPQDPGARFSSFNFSWRLPYLRKYVTLYTDSTTHDDVTPPSAPRRAAYRPGVYITQFPHLPKLDFRIEGTNTDFSTNATVGGDLEYIETVQRQGYTNKGQLFGDWVGREGKGGQAWVTYHLSPNEWVQVEYLHKKTAKDFIPGGTTQNQFKVDVVKRLRKDVELDAWVQYEGWQAPIYQSNTGFMPGNSLNKNTAIAAQFTWFPKLHSSPDPTRSPLLRMH